MTSSFRPVPARFVMPSRQPAGRASSPAMSEVRRRQPRSPTRSSPRYLGEDRGDSSGGIVDRAGALAMISAAASLVIGTVFSLDAYASPGTLIETGDELLFITVGIGVLLRAPAKYH